MVLKIRPLSLRISSTIAIFTLLSGCAAINEVQLADRCNSSLSTANAELKKAQNGNMIRAESLSTAASLISSARIQQQYERYPTCINKTARAMYYISRSSPI